MSWLLVLFLMNPSVGSSLAVERFKNSDDCMTALHRIQQGAMKKDILTKVDGICLEDKVLEDQQASKQAWWTKFPKF